MTSDVPPTAAIQACLTAIKYSPLSIFVLRSVSVPFAQNSAPLPHECTCASTPALSASPRRLFCRRPHSRKPPRGTAARYRSCSRQAPSISTRSTSTAQSAPAFTRVASPVATREGTRATATWTRSCTSTLVWAVQPPHGTPPRVRRCCRRFVRSVRSGRCFGGTTLRTAATPRGHNARAVAMPRRPFVRDTCLD